MNATDHVLSPGPADLGQDAFDPSWLAFGFRLALGVALFQMSLAQTVVKEFLQA